jgi:exonuclease SbcC
MKILRINGRNLASLAGDFSLDFENGPLADAGLFAISGPTGAGKSTLLDALSLALYDRTPRLETRSTYDIPDGPDETLGVNDTRNLLRRGAADGFAEVRFEGSDGRRHRARWSVRRAREKASGKLQKSEIEFVDDRSGQAQGRTKGEVLSAIEAAVGLTFDQFRRSILLAQGDFAAFLQARSDERSELLERMTGTELYSAVSRHAFEKAKAIEEQLRLQEQAAKALPILADEARAALRQSVAALEQSAAAIGAKLKALQDQKAWWAKEAELKHKLADAGGKLAEAERRWSEAEPRRKALAEIESVQPLRRLDQEAARTATACAAAQQRLADAATAATQARARDEHDAQAFAQAQKALDDQRVAAEVLKPQIDQAKSLDQAIADKAKLVEGTEAKLKSANAQVQSLEKEGKTLRRQHEQIAAELKALQAWVASNGHAVSLAQGWRESVEPQLKTFERTHAAWKRQAGAVPALQAAHDEAVAAHTVKQQAFDTAQASAKAAQERTRAAEEAESSQPANALGERRNALDVQRARLADQQRQREAAVAIHRQRQERLERIETARKEAAECAIKRREAAAARIEVERQAADHERLRLQLGLAAHRASLVDGQPCPLCGSPDHPGLGPIDATSAALDEQHKALDDRGRALRDEEARQQAGSETRAALAAELARDVEQLQREFITAQARWTSLGAAGDPLGEAAQAWLDGETARTDAAAKAIHELDQALATLRTAAAEARKRRDEANGRADEARGSLKRAADAVASTKEKLDKGVADRDSQRAVLDATLAHLAHAFGEVPDWRAGLESDPSAFLAKWTELIEEAGRKRRSCEASQTRLTEIGNRLELQANDLRNAARQQVELQAEKNRQVADRDALSRQRQPLLDGKAAAEAEAALQAAVKAREDAQRAADLQAKQTHADAAKKDEAHKLAQEAAEKAAREKDAASAALIDAVTRAEIGLDTLHARLAHGEPWINGERTQLAALDQQRAAEAKVADVLQKELSAHQAQAAPDQPQEAIAAALLELEPQHGAQRERLGAQRQQLQHDDDNRARGEAQAKALAQARQQARVWQQLNDLIGSADGRKFRRFAQSLTMELLLAHANAELRTLAPRYALQRVARQDLELQVVDRDMGDEIRSTSSLSGGETFLVSLALALGLSSLASEKVRIESLFVDEGFGSLDAQTLETALATLDALQSAGRKVGLISHVPGLAERIGVQVLVERQGQGASTVRVVGGLG